MYVTVSSREVGRAVCLGQVHRERIGLALSRAQLLDQRGVSLEEKGKKTYRNTHNEVCR